MNKCKWDKKYYCILHPLWAILLQKKIESPVTILILHKAVHITESKQIGCGLTVENDRRSIEWSIAEWALLDLELVISELLAFPLVKCCCCWLWWWLCLREDLDEGVGFSIEGVAAELVLFVEAGVIAGKLLLWGMGLWELAGSACPLASSPTKRERTKISIYKIINFK